MFGKIGLRAGQSKPMELCTEKINTDNESPSKNTDTGKPPIAFVPGARTAHPLLAALHTPRLLLLPSGPGTLQTVTSNRDQVDQN